jgi:hypothetical protein
MSILPCPSCLRFSSGSGDDGTIEIGLRPDCGVCRSWRGSFPSALIAEFKKRNPDRYSMAVQETARPTDTILLKIFQKDYPQEFGRVSRYVEVVLYPKVIEDFEVFRNVTPEV